MKRIIAAAAIGMLIMTLAGISAAESLWDDSKGSLFLDRRATSVGDVVTIIVSETASAKESATTETGRDASSAGMSGFVPLNDILEKLGFETSDKYKGTGTTSHQGSLSATITAQVMRVLPNGNLVLEGRKTVTINREDQIIIVRGVVRPEDVSINNTVQSYLIADAEIEYTGKGSIQSKQKPGLISRIFGWLF